MGQCGEGGRAGHVLCWLHGVADARGEDGRGGGGKRVRFLYSNTFNLPCLVFLCGKRFFLGPWLRVGWSGRPYHADTFRC